MRTSTDNTFIWKVFFHQSAPLSYRRELMKLWLSAVTDSFVYSLATHSKNISNLTLGKSLRRETELLLNQLHKMASPFGFFAVPLCYFHLPPYCIQSRMNYFSFTNWTSPFCCITSKPCSHYKVILKASSASHAHDMARKWLTYYVVWWVCNRQAFCLKRFSKRQTRASVAMFPNYAVMH